MQFQFIILLGQARKMILRSEALCSSFREDNSNLSIMMFMLAVFYSTPYTVKDGTAQIEFNS